MAERRREPSRAVAQPRRLGRPPASVGSETRDRIVDTARRYFGAKGYSAATNSDVASEAGITTGAIYHYFRSKEELYRTVFEDAQTTIYDRFAASVVDVAGCIPKLHAVLEAAIVLQRADPWLAEFVVSVSSESRRHPELADLHKLQEEGQRKFFLPIVNEGVQTGELVAGVDVDQVMEMVLAVLGGLARYATVTHDLDRHAAAVRGFQQLLDGRLLSNRGKLSARGRGAKGPILQVGDGKAGGASSRRRAEPGAALPSPRRAAPAR